MPVVDVDPDELRRLTGHEERDDERLRADLFALGLEYEGETEAGEMRLEFGPDRLDRLSVEGIARSLRYQYGDDRGVYVPPTNDPDWTIEVDGSVPAGRPYVTGAVIRGLDLDESSLASLIQLQEKLHATMGRERAKGAIGIHDLTMLKGAAGTEGRKTITYRGVEPDGDRFVPLDADAAMTPADVLDDHAVGERYAHLVAGLDRYPAIYDEVGLFSFPPVINGARTEVDTGSRELFVEMTGTDQWTIDRMLNVVCYALDARGATIERVDVRYADDAVVPEAGPRLERPDLSVETKRVPHDRLERVLGVDLDPAEAVDLFERSGLDAEPTEAGDEETVHEVSVPPYRVDVLHPLDLIDDAGRAYGFNDLAPRYPDVATVGSRHDRSRLEDAVRSTLVGLGFEDLLDFHMIAPAENFDRMGLAPADDAFGAAEPVRITEPYSEDYAALRTWALPSLTMVLENNTHRAYPQDLAEIGLVARVDGTEPTGVAERRDVAAVLARPDASYEDAKSRLAALCRAFGADLATPATEHPSFIDGRAATVRIDGAPAGVIGEFHPRVLVEHDLELPVAAFELRLAALADDDE
jgi:phenylalanyl-tRNA synthetase beta chain